MSSVYNPAAWYWVVGGSPTQVFASQAGAYVPTTDAAYVIWRTAGNRPSAVSSQQELADVLSAAGVALPAGWVESDASKDRRVSASDTVALRIAFRHENLIRELNRALRASSTAANTAATSAGLPSAANSADLTLAQFLAAIRSLL